MKDILREYCDELMGRAFAFEMTRENKPDDDIKESMTLFAKRMVEWADCYPNRPSNLFEFMIKEAIDLAKAKAADRRTFDSLFGETNHP